jgi:hypothetical protein
LKLRDGYIFAETNVVPAVIVSAVRSLSEHFPANLGLDKFRTFAACTAEVVNYSLCWCHSQWLPLIIKFIYTLWDSNTRPKCLIGLGQYMSCCAWLPKPAVVEHSSAETVASRMVISILFGRRSFCWKYGHIRGHSWSSCHAERWLSWTLVSEFSRGGTHSRRGAEVAFELDFTTPDYYMNVC